MSHVPTPTLRTALHPRTQWASAGRHVAALVGAIVTALAGSPTAGQAPAGPRSIIISEVHPGGSSNPAYAADWFEVTNTGFTSIDVTGWKMDDNSNSFAVAVELSGVGSIGPGRSVIFVDASTPVDLGAFSTAWFGADAPASLVIGTYGGGGVGLSAAL